MPNLTSKDPEAQYSTPSTGGRQAKEETHYENTDLYENMPPSKLATRYPPKSSSSSTSSSSASKNHYKTPVNKVSSKFLSADAKTKDAAQVTNTLLLNPHCFPPSLCIPYRSKIPGVCQIRVTYFTYYLDVYLLSSPLCSHCCGDFTNLNLRLLVYVCSSQNPVLSLQNCIALFVQNTAHLA